MMSSQVIINFGIPLFWFLTFCFLPWRFFHPQITQNRSLTHIPIYYLPSMCVMLSPGPASSSAPLYWLLLNWDFSTLPSSPSSFSCPPVVHDLGWFGIFAYDSINNLHYDPPFDHVCLITGGLLESDSTDLIRFPAGRLTTGAFYRIWLVAGLESDGEAVMTRRYRLNVSRLKWR